jgi:ABC-2 type transport system ATP-binding protein
MTCRPPFAGGAVTGFLGPNGAGKTTALKTIVGLASPTAGAR